MFLVDRKDDIADAESRLKEGLGEKQDTFKSAEEKLKQFWSQ